MSVCLLKLLDTLLSKHLSPQRIYLVAINAHWEAFTMTQMMFYSYVFINI